MTVKTEKKPYKVEPPVPLALHMHHTIEYQMFLENIMPLSPPVMYSFVVKVGGRNTPSTHLFFAEKKKKAYHLCHLLVVDVICFLYFKNFCLPW